MKKYPYQNTDLKSIKGEIWKNIPGLEFYFKVSNLGRIKRQRYEMEYSDGRIYIKPEQIIKPVVFKVPNNFINDSVFFLSAGVTLHKQKYHFSLARLVYYRFVKPFKMDDYSIVILTKNRNGLDINPGNLKIASRSEKQKRIFDLKRRQPLFVDAGARSRAIEKLRLRNNKLITQYSMKGKRIKTYPSIVEASKETGIGHSHIANRARGIEFSAGGFIWRHGKAVKTDIEPMLLKIEQRLQVNKEAFGKKLTQYQMDGKRVAIFPTINDAAIATGVMHSSISLVIRNKRFSAGGFYWQNGYGPTMIDLSGHQYGAALRAKNRQRPVKQYSKKGKYLQTFESVKAASFETGVHSTTILGVLSGKNQTAGGYKWKRAKLRRVTS